MHTKFNVRVEDDIHLENLCHNQTRTKSKTSNDFLAFVVRTNTREGDYYSKFVKL